MMPKPMIPNITVRSLCANCDCSSWAVAGSTSPVHRITFEVSCVAW